MLASTSRRVCTRVASSAQRSFATSSRPVASSSAAAARVYESAAPVHTPSLMEKMFGQSKAPRISLDTPFPGLAPLQSSDLSSLPNVNTPARISTLPSGIRVATLPSASPIASVGVFIDAGSRYETPETNGITNFLELMSFKSTQNRSDFRLVRDMLKLGANVGASSGREHFIFSADCLNEHVPHVLGTLGDVIQNHSFDQQEMIEAREHYLAANEQREQIVDMQLMESVHEAAYNGTGLGLSLFAPSHNLDSFTSEAMKAYTKQIFTPKRMVISAVGVDHDELVKLTGETFNKLSDSVDTPRQKSVYVGGEVRQHKRNEGNGLTHFALAFETANWHSPDLVAMCVLQMMMGGGGSFSAGGPGKGMYSRLYSNVLNKYDWAESCTCFNSIFTDSSLFGIYGTSIPEKSRNLVDVISKEFIRMAGPVDATELARAKNQLRSAVYMQLESRALKLEDIGRQVMTYGKIVPVAELSKQIEAVTPADIQRVAKNMLATPVTIAAAGDLTAMPRYDQIQRAFK